MFLQNLIQFTPGNFGFNSYIRKIYPSIPGFKIFIKNGLPYITAEEESLPTNLLLKNPLKLIHRYFFLQYFINCEKEFKKNKLNINDIHCIYSPLTEYLFQLKKIPQIITCHDLTPLFYSNTKRQKLRYEYLIPLHLKKSKKIIAISKFSANQLVEIGISSKKIEVIYNGVETIKQPIKNPTTNDIIVLARHDLNKNVPYVLYGYDKLIKQYNNWNGKLYIIGKEGKQSKLIKEIVKEINSSNIFLIDQLSKKSLIEYMKKSFLLISPSLMEGFNYPIIEAMSMGLPTLISDIPLHKELYDQSSMLFKMNDMGKNMANLILEIYKDNNLWSDLSKKGYLFSKKFSIEKQQSRIIKILDSI